MDREGLQVQRTWLCPTPKLAVCVVVLRRRSQRLDAASLSTGGQLGGRCGWRVWVAALQGCATLWSGSDGGGGGSGGGGGPLACHPMPPCLQWMAVRQGGARCTARCQPLFGHPALLHALPLLRSTPYLAYQGRQSGPRHCPGALRFVYALCQGLLPRPDAPCPRGADTSGTVSPGGQPAHALRPPAGD